MRRDSLNFQEREREKDTNHLRLLKTNFAQQVDSSHKIFYYI